VIISVAGTADCSTLAHSYFFLRTNMATTEDVVVIDYKELVDENCDLKAKIEKAYGFDGLGILSVTSVPDYVQLRQNLLPLASKFAKLPEDVKQKYTHEESFWSFGWSHGKEQLEGKPDFSKGSYYNNPLHDKPVDDPELIKKYPAFCHPNIWPKEHLPELESAFKALGKKIVEVGILLSRHCDNFVRSKVPDYPAHRLKTVVETSRTPKARLLHYFPLSEKQGLLQGAEDTVESISSWCGWHNDHGSLPGLTAAMYIDENGKEVANPDPKAGLYIRARNGRLVKAAVPADRLIFQIGETAQIHSGGVLQATPHCVRGAQGEKARGIARDTFAVFMEPMWMERMDVPPSVSVDRVTVGSTGQYLPPGVPTLASRWNSQQDFAEFTAKTLTSYY